MSIDYQLDYSDFKEGHYSKPVWPLYSTTMFAFWGYNKREGENDSFKRLYDNYFFTILKYDRSISYRCILSENY